MNQDDRQDRIMSRREMLTLLGSAGAAVLSGPSLSQPGAASGATSLSCIATPEQTEGPYFVDERVNRSDIRSDPADGSMKEGVPLILRISVSTISNAGCQPLAGAIVDVWHCDAGGLYSDTRDPRVSTIGKKFLRGFQATDEKGAVQFTTIYPGWYPGRAVHIHFKIRTDPKSLQAREFTSQLYFDDAITDRVHVQAPYASRAGRRARNERDGLYRDGGEQLMLRLVENGRGYAGSFDVGLRMA